MTTEPTFDLDLNRLTRHINLRVRFTGERRFGAKLWMAVQLIRLAAWVLGVGIEVDASATGKIEDAA
jgi:hypothetical protein